MTLIRQQSSGFLFEDRSIATFSSDAQCCRFVANLKCTSTRNSTADAAFCKRCFPMLCFTDHLIHDETSRLYTGGGGQLMPYLSRPVETGYLKASGDFMAGIRVPFQLQGRKCSANKIFNAEKFRLQMHACN